VIRAASLALADRLIAAGCGHVIQFSTASVLRGDGPALPVAVQHGTPYIRAKAELTAGITARAGPGRANHGAVSDAGGGCRPEQGRAAAVASGTAFAAVAPYIGLVRFLSAGARFLLIHAADIATVTRHLLARPTEGGLRLVPGNPAQSLEETLTAAARHLGTRRRRVLALRPWLAEVLILVRRIRLSPWDRWCRDHPDQSCADPVNPAPFGLPVRMPETGTALALVGVAAVRRGTTGPPR